MGAEHTNRYIEGVRADRAVDSARETDALASPLVGVDSAKSAHSMAKITIGVLLVAFGVLAAAVAASFRLGITFYMLVADGNAIAHLHPLVGALSYLGIMLWWAAAVVWLVAAWAQNACGDRHLFLFALCSGLLSSYLAFDDLFEIHEQLLPRYLGISETAVYAVLGVVTLVYVIAFWKDIHRTALPLFVLAMIFFVISLGIDKGVALLAVTIPNKSIYEEGAKWMGIACWLGYAVMWARVHVIEAFARSATQ